MLILRTYVLYERSKRVLALMITVSVGGGVVGLVRLPLIRYGYDNYYKIELTYLLSSGRFSPEWLSTKAPIYLCIPDATTQPLGRSEFLPSIFSKECG
jgi:hypothetical protein